ncbi:MAG TPA: hypothetical protein GYA07_14245 [Verrucomicrobia bacterium]|nr:hypothetical protein [Verrucomicrobiota bacterium]HOB31295.1 cation transporter [Verrucomicrobiota bacterium]HOP98602.1 cation transporter [Verrucomicrobiota bacterium]
MKKSIAVILFACAMTLPVCAADVSAKITGVHLCCKACVDAVQKAIAPVNGATASVDRDARTVTLTGPDAATVQKAADALVAAGYYGKSENSNIKIAADAGAKGTKVPSLKLEGVHLCCNQCVSAVDKAVKSVAGVKEHTATRNASSFEVKGDFEDKAVIQALHDAGLAAKVGGNQ